MSDKQVIRSFIAIEVSPEVKSNISKLQAEMKSSEYKFVKWVSPESIHITLKFLGNISYEKVEEIADVMRNVSLLQESDPRAYVGRPHKRAGDRLGGRFVKLADTPGDRLDVGH